jgi:hypothetical protein
MLELPDPDDPVIATIGNSSDIVIILPIPDDWVHDTNAGDNEYYRTICQKT